MVEWINESRINVRGTRFAVASWAARPQKMLQIMKERFQIDEYARLADEIGPDASIVELGIRTGASTAFLAILFEPRLLSAFDIDSQSSELFNKFLASHPDAARIRTHFECDQGDAAKLSRLVNDDFGNLPLDAVIDDASHLLAPTTTSFNILFPRLRPGGVFVIEDWSWEHYTEGLTGQADVGVFEELVTGFARLALEAVLVSAHSPDIISKVLLMRGIAVIYRGPAPLDPEAFDIRDYLGEKGTQLLAARSQ